MYIRSYSDEIYRALRLGSDIFLVVAASNVCHDGEFEACVLVFDDDIEDVLIDRELPLAELIHIEHCLISSVADFHIVNAGPEV